MRLAVRRLNRNTYSSRGAGRGFLLTAPWWVPSRQRLTRPKTRWMPGSRSAASGAPGSTGSWGWPLAPRPGEPRSGGAGIDRLLGVAFGRQAGVAGPAVGRHGGGGGDGRAEEALEARGRGVGHHRGPQPAEAPPPPGGRGRPRRPPSASPASTAPATSVLPAAPRPRLPGRGPPT